MFILGCVSLHKAAPESRGAHTASTTRRRRTTTTTTTTRPIRVVKFHPRSAYRSTSILNNNNHQPSIKSKSKSKSNMSAIALQQKSKGDTFLQQAEQELNKKSWFSSKDKKFEDACELYQNAGNAYKVGGFYFEAGQAYHKAATILKDDLKNSFEASKAFQNAGEWWWCCCCACVSCACVCILVVSCACRFIQSIKFISHHCGRFYIGVLKVLVPVLICGILDYCTTTFLPHFPIVYPCHLTLSFFLTNSPKIYIYIYIIYRRLIYHRHQL